MIPLYTTTTAATTTAQQKQQQHQLLTNLFTHSPQPERNEGREERERGRKEVNLRVGLSCSRAVRRKLQVKRPPVSTIPLTLPYLTCLPITLSLSLQRMNEMDGNDKQCSRRDHRKSLPPHPFSAFSFSPSAPPYLIQFSFIPVFAKRISTRKGDFVCC